MEDYRAYRHRTALEAQRKKRKRRKRALLVLLLAAVLMTGGYYGRGYLLRGKEKPQETTDAGAETPQDQEEEVPQETPSETPVKEEPVGTPPVETVLESPAEGENSPETSPEEKDSLALMPGANHSYKANAYAYSTEDAKAWMRGKKQFEGGGKLVFLTFDDGPVKNTPGVLDVLKRRGIPGTFFLLGKSIETVQDSSVLNRYIEEGHGIGIHSYSHEYSYLYPGRTANRDRIVEEYNRTLGLLKERLGESFDTKVFRFPGGSMSWKNIPEAQSALGGLGVIDIDWNAMSGDAEPKSRRPESPDAMAKYAMETFKNSGNLDVAVILMHDAQSVTAEYLDALIDEFQAEGFTFGILK